MAVDPDNASPCDERRARGRRFQGPFAHQRSMVGDPSSTSRFPAGQRRSRPPAITVAVRPEPLMAADGRPMRGSVYSVSAARDGYPSLRRDVRGDLVRNADAVARCGARSRDRDALGDVA